MQAALVVGHCNSTVKHETLEGKKLLVTQPLMANGTSPDGEVLLAIDAVNAGPGDRVMISSDSKLIREFFDVENSPIRWTVIGILDPDPTEN